MTTHSSILAWEIPWTEEPGGLWFMELQSHPKLQCQEVCTREFEFETNVNSFNLFNLFHFILF